MPDPSPVKSDARSTTDAAVSRASGLDDACARLFESTVDERGGWHLKPADVAFVIATLVLAVACALALWRVFGQGPQSQTEEVSSPQASVPAGDAQDGPASTGGEVDAQSGSAPVTDGQGDSASAVDAQDGPVAVVQNTEGFYLVMPLSEDATVTVTSSLGTNVIEVRDGAVRCSEADCANQVCVNSGWARSVTQMIVCLPHELTVQVVANEADAVPLI